MCSCNKKNAQNNQRGRSPVRPATVQTKSVVPNVGVNGNERAQRALLRRDALRRAKGF